jgi:hypothetical protein
MNPTTSRAHAVHLYDPGLKISSGGQAILTQAPARWLKILIIAGGNGF